MPTMSHGHSHTSLDSLQRNVYGHVDEHAEQRRLEMERERAEQIMKEQWEQQQHASRPPSSASATADGVGSAPKMSAAAEAAARRRAKILGASGERMKIVAGAMNLSSSELAAVAAATAPTSDSISTVSFNSDAPAAVPAAAPVPAPAPSDDDDEQISRRSSQTSTASSSGAIGPSNFATPVPQTSYASNTPTVTELSQTFSALKVQQQLAASRRRQRHASMVFAVLCALFQVAYRFQLLDVVDQLVKLPAGNEWLPFSLFIALQVVVVSAYSIARQSLGKVLACIPPFHESRIRAVALNLCVA